MTKKVFEMVASVLLRSAIAIEERRYVADLFADEFARVNPSFDRAKFLKACGL